MAPACIVAAAACAELRLEPLLRGPIGAILRELAPATGDGGCWFERVNKPHWGLRLVLFALDDGLVRRWRTRAERTLAELGQRGEVESVAIGEAETDDKWVGDAAQRALLAPLHMADALAALDLLDLEARGAIRRTRAEFSLLVVENLLDLFELCGAARLEFYRLGYAWAIESGRWDDDVIAALEDKQRTQRAPLRALLAARAEARFDAEELWGGAAAAWARRLLDAARAPVAAALAAAAAGHLAGGVVGLANCAAHAHCNRLGVYATQEAVLRYLLERSHADAPGSAP